MQALQTLFVLRREFLVAGLITLAAPSLHAQSALALDAAILPLATQEAPLVLETLKQLTSFDSGTGQATIKQADASAPLETGIMAEQYSPRRRTHARGLWHRRREHAAPQPARQSPARRGNGSNHAHHDSRLRCSGNARGLRGGAVFARVFERCNDSFHLRRSASLVICYSLTITAGGKSICINCLAPLTKSSRFLLALAPCTR